MNLENTYRGKRILVTGHTGFKGAWLTLWLAQMGCEIAGLALDPQPGAARLFRMIESSLTEDFRQDIRDEDAVAKIVQSVEPDFVFHLAAQPLVIESYRDPVTTVSTNILGTANLLNAVKGGAQNAHTIIVTTDKCYENREERYVYRECDRLGGHDVYAASKAATEIVVAAFNRSFFESTSVPGRVVTARGGNVIGGGDFSENRIMPDIVRALSVNQPVCVRNPDATRPWQHVLDCLSGYLALGKWMVSDEAGSFQDRPRAFNFGPVPSCERSVSDLVKEVFETWPGSWENNSRPDSHHEASRLSIAIDLADSVLGWRPVWQFPETVRRTVEWYRAESSGAGDTELQQLMISQIDDLQSVNSA